MTNGHKPFISVAGGRWYTKVLIKEDPPRPFPLYWDKITNDTLQVGLTYRGQYTGFPLAFTWGTLL